MKKYILTTVVIPALKHTLLKSFPFDHVQFVRLIVRNTLKIYFPCFVLETTNTN